MRGVSRSSQSLLAYSLRAAAAAVFLASLAACANWPANDDTTDTGDLLRNSLPVAAAALAAGQLNVARRLYLSLSERFDSAAEPFLGLGYIAFQSGDFAAAERYFLQAAERAADAPAQQAEALLGAGRTALVQNKPRAARRHFGNAQVPAQDTPSAPWVANGLAVTAALEDDYDDAEAHYADALRLSSDNPRIAANLIRMLVAAGRIDDAARTYARHPPTYWLDDDTVLSRLIEDARRQRRVQALARPRAAAPNAMAKDESRAPGDSAQGRTDQGVSPLRPDQKVTDLVAPPALDPDLAMRLYLSDALPAQANADMRPDARIAPPDSPGLMLRFDDWPDSPTSPTAVDDTVLNSAGSAVSGISEDSPSLRAVPLSRSPAAAGESTATLPTQISRPPEPIATGSGSTTPAPQGLSPQIDSRAPDSGLAGSETTEARSSVRSAAAQTRPLPESEPLALASRDHSSPATLTLILGQSRRLNLEHDATTVLVASPEVADVQLLAPNVLYVIGKGVGRTSVAVLDDNEWIEERVVSVVLDMEPLRTILAADSDLHVVRARRLSRGIALTGEVASAASVDRALRLAAGALPEGVPIENDMRIAAPQQVNLEVQIAEVHRSVTEDLGVNWESFGVEGSGRFGFRVGQPFPRVGGDVDLALGALPPALIDGSPASTIFLGSQGPRGRFQLMIDALATAGLANVLARPNVTAVSGESASFFSGGERPIPSGYDTKTGTILFEYKKVGVLLDFVPTVVDTDRIVLTVRPEVSEPDASQLPLSIAGIPVPVINVRRAETTVGVADGESIVIAGLFSNRSSTSETGLPVLKDVPLFGLLFGKTSIRSNEQELIVVVTARLVQPHTTPDDTNAPAATLQANGYHY